MRAFLAGIAMVGCLLAVGEAHSEMIVFPDETNYQVVDPQEALGKFDAALRVRFERAVSRIEAAYEVTLNGIARPHHGIYVVGRLRNGDVLWLVKAEHDQILTIATLQTLAYVPSRSWRGAVRASEGQRIPMPTVYSFVPGDYIRAYSYEYYGIVGRYFNRPRWTRGLRHVTVRSD